MTLALVGDGPVNRQLAGRVKASTLFDWQDSVNKEGITGLCFEPPRWLEMPDDPVAVVDDLEIVWRWLNDWVPQAKAAGEGVILYIISQPGLCATPDNLLLAEREGALLSQAKSMALELGRFGIRSNVLAVGPFDPEEGVPEANPLKRAGTPVEAAGVARFLLGDEAAHLTGQVLFNTGGAEVGQVLP